MGERKKIIAGDKSFELSNTSEDYDRWFTLIERGRRFTSSIRINEAICVGCVKFSLKLRREGEIDAEGGKERSNATHSG